MTGDFEDTHHDTTSIVGDAASDNESNGYTRRTHLEAQRLRRRQKRIEQLSKIKVDMAIGEVELASKLATGNIQAAMPEDVHFFSDVGKSPAKAMLLFYLNSGLMRFQQHREYMKRWEGLPVDTNGLKTEIRQEKQTDNEMQATLRHFLKRHSFTSERLPACASCGTRQMERSMDNTAPFKYVSLNLDSELASPLSYSTENDEVGRLLRDMASPSFRVDIPIDDTWTMKTVELWKLRSVFVRSDTERHATQYWHLHPELVVQKDNDTCEVLVCPSCMTELKKGKRPRFSIAAGIDFGHYRRLGLELPNLLELQILSRMRLFFVTVKVSSNTYGVVNGALLHKYKCHAILFPHDAPKVSSYMFQPDVFAPNGLLDYDMLKGLLQVYMVDHEANVDNMFRHIFGTSVVQARSWVVAQWLTVLKWSHAHYRDIDVTDLERTKKVIAGLNQYVRDATVRVTNPDTVAFNENIGCDIVAVQNAEVNTDAAAAWRTGIGMSQDTDVTTEEREEETPMNFSYVTSTEHGYLSEDKNTDFRIRALGKLANLKASDIAEDPQNREDMIHDLLFDQRDAVDDYMLRHPGNMQGTSARGELPVNWFGRDDRALTSCFPHVFMFGKAYGKPVGRLHQEVRHHLLHQFTLVPSLDRRLLGFLFDTMQRTKVFDSVKAYVDSNAASLQKIRELIESPEERRALKRAVEMPYTSNARKTFGKYMPHLRMAGSRVSYGATEGMVIKRQIMALSNRYGPMSAFITLTPSNLDNPRALRCSFRTVDNRRFPCVFEENCPYGANAQEFLRNFNCKEPLSEGDIFLPHGVRAEYALTNPIAFVDENKALIGDIMFLLFGLPIEHSGYYHAYSGVSKRATTYYRHFKGAMGHSLAYGAVMEENKRGTEHWHLIILVGLSAYLLQRFSNLPEICKEISAVLDAHFVSRVPEHVHVASLTCRCIQDHSITWGIDSKLAFSIRPESVTATRASFYHTTMEGERDVTMRDVSDHTYEQAGMQNDHVHMSRCFKEPYGYDGCALDQPQCCVEETQPVLLRPFGENPVEPIPQMEVDAFGTLRPVAKYTVVPTDVLVSEENTNAGVSYRLEDVLEGSLSSDVVVWETKRPVIRSRLFASDLEDIEDVKAHVLAVFRETLQKCIYRGNTETFWIWMEKEASDLQLVTLYNYVKRKLPLSNGYIAVYNPMLSLCSSSHNNTILLGSTTQAKSALFYIIPYEAKKKVGMEQCLPILEEVLQHIRKHPSTWYDSGTAGRTVKHFLTRVLNQMHLRIEISDWQVASADLELPSAFTSDDFDYCNPSALANLACHMQMGQDVNEAFSTICGELSLAEQQAAIRGRSLLSRWYNNMPESNHTEPLVDANEDSTSAYTRYAVGKELGLIIQAKVNIGNDVDNPERKVIFPKTAYYYYRGQQLEDMTYYEYTALVEAVNKKPSSKPDDPANLQVLRQFRTSSDFLCHADSYQVLRRKQCTPIFVGQPPRHPGPAPPDNDSDESKAALGVWSEKANEYARFYLAYFRPHVLHQGSTWSDLLSYVHTLQNSSRIIDTFRLMIMHQHMRGLRVLPACVDASRHYRARTRDMWTAQEKAKRSVVRATQRKQKLDLRFNDVFAETHDNATDIISQRTLTSWAGQFQHDIKQSQVLASLDHPTNENKPRCKRSFAAISSYKPRECQLLVEKMKDWKPSPSPTRKRKHSSLSTKAKRQLMKRVRNSLIRPGGSCANQQTRFVDRYIDEFAPDPDSNQVCHVPQITILHGPPGAGKTHTRNAIHKIADICDRFKLKVSFNSINAAEMGGSTVCSHIGNNASMHMNEIGSFSDDVVGNLRRMGFQRDSIITVEEFETNAPWHLARLNQLCQDANANKLPFGGCLVILIGDLGQLPPVKAGANLSQAVMDVNLSPDLRKKASSNRVRVGDTILPAKRKEDAKYSYGHPYYIGQNLLTSAKWYELSEQWRSRDRVHNEMIGLTYHRCPINMEDVKNRGYKILSSDDLTKEEWLRASVLVVTNRERYTLTLQRAVDLARFLGKPVIRWMSDYSSWKNQPPPAFVNDALKDPCFYEVFVETADGFLSDNYMKKLRLINGTKLTYISLVFDNVEERKIVEMYVGASHPGDIVTLPFRPLAVVVEVDLPSETEEEVLQALRQFALKANGTTATDNKFVIPIYNYNSKWTSNGVPIPGGHEYGPSSVHLKSVFPLEPAFVITAHKALGRTIFRTIIALSGGKPSGCNYSYRQVHVAMSRVRCREHIRLLLVGSNESEQWRSLLYLGDLKPDPSVSYFFAGYRPYHGQNPNKNWDTNSWDAQRANDWYRDSLL